MIVLNSILIRAVP